MITNIDEKDIPQLECISEIIKQFSIVVCDKQNVAVQVTGIIYKRYYTDNPNLPDYLWSVSHFPDEKYGDYAYRHTEKTYEAAELELIHILCSMQKKENVDWIQRMTDVGW